MTFEKYLNCKNVKDNKVIFIAFKKEWNNGLKSEKWDDTFVHVASKFELKNSKVVWEHLKDKEVLGVIEDKYITVVLDEENGKEKFLEYVRVHGKE